MPDFQVVCTITREDGSLCWRIQCLTPGCELATRPEVGDHVAVSLTASVHAGRLGHRVELARISA